MPAIPRLNRLPRLVWLALVAAACIATCPAHADPVDVVKTNPMPVYVHYMPWFDTPAVLGGNQWGYHWKMNTQNPNIVLPNGQRQIASHYYPQIGPYDSSDPDVIEYHLLLIKLSGIDGVLIDWYGVQGTNGDIGLLLTNSNALINQVDDFGLDFAVVLEDRFAANAGQTQANVAYLRDNYFNNPAYIRDQTTNEPLLPVFGPITLETPAQWTQVLSAAGEDVDLLTLPYESGEAGANADGEYFWVFEDEAQDDFLARQANFYQNRAPALGTAGGSAFPGFRDFYQEGGAGPGIPFEIPYDNGQTLVDTLDLVDQEAANLDFLQLVTWNDFGEGTMIEPTVEFGYDPLTTIQQYTGVSYTQADLELVHALYLARKNFAGDPVKQAGLDQVSGLLAELRINEARALLEQVVGVAVPGDYNDDGLVDEADLALVLTHWGVDGSTPPAGWTNDLPDGVIGAQQMDVVLARWSPAPAAIQTPEPGSAVALGVLFAAAGLSRRR